MSVPPGWQAEIPPAGIHHMLILMSMQLQFNEQANETAYTRAIRDRLLSHDGRPIVERRAVADACTDPSLYSKAARIELGIDDA